MAGVNTGWCISPALLIFWEEAWALDKNRTVKVINYRGQNFCPMMLMVEQELNLACFTWDQILCLNASTLQ